MRDYIPDWENIEIDKERYLELIHFCRQYQNWKNRVSSQIGSKGRDFSRVATKNIYNDADPVAMAVIRREDSMKKIQLVEDCANEVENGKWFYALIQNICMGKALSDISPLMLPSTNRNSFIKARKLFFLLLDRKKCKSGDI